MARISGVFHVSLQPQAMSDDAGRAGIGRRSLDKRFEGLLSGNSVGEMLSFLTETPGSMAYVALERFTGTLDGRAGGFVLQHASVMARGTPTQHVAVVPDSGSGDLQGLSGQMQIRIENGVHYYDFDYELPAA